MIAQRLTDEQLLQLGNYARDIGDTSLLGLCMRALDGDSDTSLLGLCMRALDGDSLYDSAIMERCAAAYAGAHHFDEFLLANLSGDRSKTSLLRALGMRREAHGKRKKGCVVTSWRSSNQKHNQRSRSA